MKKKYLINYGRIHEPSYHEWYEGIEKKFTSFDVFETNDIKRWLELKMEFINSNKKYRHKDYWSEEGAFLRRKRDKRKNEISRELEILEGRL